MNSTLAANGSASEPYSLEQLRERIERLEAALNNMSQGLCMFDAQERLVVCNERYVRMYRLSRQQVRPGCTLSDLLQLRIANGTFSRDSEAYRRELRAAMTNGETTSQIVESADGRTIHVVNEPMPGGGWVATHEDITERQRAEKELSRTRAFLNTVIDNIPATVIVKDARTLKYLLINRAGEKLIGLSAQEIIGKDVYDLYPKEQADYLTKFDLAAVRSGKRVTMGDHEFRASGGDVRMVNSKKLAILDDNGAPEYLLTVAEDITERRRAEQQIAHMAHHDPLTDLPNRTAFKERLALTLDRAAADRGSFAVLCIDLDRFKEVNDVFGHSVGDGLLREVASRLQLAAHGAFLARLGGDEFMLITADGPQPATAAMLADRLVASVAGDLDVEGHRLRIGLSIGVAIYPTDGRDVGTLLGNADAALYRAKAEGRAGIRFFEAEMDRVLRQRRALQHDLRTALDSGELAIDFQPQAGVGREIVGFEALVRWYHPVRGLVPPATFIPLAEENGLIIPIGEWILREACREAASWRRPLQIAINLSPVQFRHGDLPALVHSVLLETGLAPKRLELEVTESVLIGDFSRAVSVLRRLKALGVRIAMDDFGTGYSSLSYLQSFPFDKIKIDKSFISNLESNAQAAAIVRAVIALGRGLELPVVAEGVETEEQLRFLAREACDGVQGFLVGRPGPIEHFAALVGRPTAPEASPRRTERAVLQG